MLWKRDLEQYPFLGDCPFLGGSFIRGSTVLTSCYGGNGYYCTSDNCNSIAPGPACHIEAMGTHFLVSCRSPYHLARVTTVYVVINLTGGIVVVVVYKGLFYMQLFCLDATN